MSSKVQILSDIQVKQIIKRLAYQVYENNFNEKELIIAGIQGRGEQIATLICKELLEIGKIKITATSILMDRTTMSAKQIQLSNDTNVTNKVVIVVDDVLYTGKTMMYALIPLVKDKAKKIQTLVLVDRNHNSFPIVADYYGTALSTTLQEHIEVNINKTKVNVYLM